MRPASFVLLPALLVLSAAFSFGKPGAFARAANDDFPWQTLESGALEVSWYEGDAEFGQAVLDAAEAGLESISRLIAPDLTRPIGIFIYARADDLRSALPPGEDWVAGHAEPALGMVMVVIPPGPDERIAMEQRIPHELMHVMLYRRVGAGYAGLPAWLREGMATLAEIYPNADYERVLADAAARDDLIPLRGLCSSFPADAGQAFLAYAESRSFVSHLYRAYGSRGLLTLAESYADGLDCERGTERAFGASLSSLESQWRASTLGQNPWRSALQNILPYLVLLCLVLLIPLAGIARTLRRKGDRHGSGSQIR